MKTGLYSNRRPMHEDRQLRATDDIIRHAAEQEPRQAAASVRLDGDHVDRRFRVVEDRDTRLFLDHNARLHPEVFGPEPLGDLVEIIGRFFTEFGVHLFDPVHDVAGDAAEDRRLGGKWYGIDWRDNP